MRKIEQAMCAAIKMHKSMKCGNTEVECGRTLFGNYKKVVVKLHGNEIFKWNEAEDIAEFTLAGVIHRLRVHVCAPLV